LVEDRFASRGAHSIGSARDLNERRLRRYLGAEQGGYADHALLPDHPDFDRRAVSHNVQYRSGPFLDEVDFLDRSSCRVQDLCNKQTNCRFEQNCSNSPKGSAVSSRF
jgi:hypothetical protein